MEIHHCGNTHHQVAQINSTDVAEYPLRLLNLKKISLEAPIGHFLDSNQYILAGLKHLCCSKVSYFRRSIF